MAEFKRIEVTDPAHADVLNEKIVEPAIELAQKVNSHLNDDVSHITSAERAYWNSKQDALPVENRRKITFGTADPVGGEDGDIYFQYE